MPVLTSASAISLINFSLTLQPNLFQLFQPIGGVRASPLSSARASDALTHATTNERHRSQRKRRGVRFKTEGLATEARRHRGLRMTERSNNLFSSSLCLCASVAVFLLIPKPSETFTSPQRTAPA